MLKYVFSLVAAVAGILLQLYSAVIIVAARGHAAAMPSRYRSMSEISNIHDASSSFWHVGVFEFTASGGNSTLSVGKFIMPLPASEIVGWMTAALATLLMLGSVYVIVRAFRTQRQVDRAS